MTMSADVVTSLLSMPEDGFRNMVLDIVSTLGIQPDEQAAVLGVKK